jgi:hypothetical protein
MRNAIVAGALVALTSPAVCAGFSYTSAGQAELHPIIAPTARPNVTTTDPISCVTESVKQKYLDGPKPSGSLDEAMISYGSKLIATCLTSGTYSYPCAFPDKSLWCGVTTAIAASLLPAYSSYASNASSWWSVHSSSAVMVAQECPILWYEASNFGVLGGAVWLNHTLINAECYAEANPTAQSTTSATATPGQGATGGGSTPTPTPTSTAPRAQNRGAQNRAEKKGLLWAVAAFGLAVAVVNAAL